MYLKFKLAKVAYDAAHALATAILKAMRHSIVVKALQNIVNHKK